MIIIGLLQYIDFSYKNLNINLFQSKLKYTGKHCVRYYNKYNNLMTLNSKQTKLVLKLIQYLKNKYNNEIFFIGSDSQLDICTIEGQIYLNKIKYLKSIQDKADIYIFFGGHSNTNFHMPRSVFQKRLLQCFHDMQNISYIKKEYYIIDIFYLDENQKEDTKVILLGKKDKFPEFSE